MFLGELDNSADARDIDYARRKSLYVVRTLVQKSQERHGYEEYREGVDCIQIRPLLGSLVIK